MRNLINLIESVNRGCPPATQSIDLNLKNRQKAIDEYHYGPLNPAEPNDEYWGKIADQWNTNIEEAKSARCGNCAAFDITEKTLDCINKGIGGNDNVDIIEAGKLGYCRFLKFKCNALRTCSGWVEGGPITEQQLDELDFLGSPCTKDCSGHRAGYEWYKRKGRDPYSNSPSFNNGATLARMGK